MPGGLSSAVFRLMTPAKNLTRYADLFMNMWDREYVNGFDAMNQWVSQFIDYPQGAFLQFMRDFMQHNALVRGKMRFGGKVADMDSVRANLLAFAGRTDLIAPAAAVRAQVDAVGSTDDDLRLGPGGHMGVFAGAGAPKHVWQPAAEWLAARSSRVRCRRARRRAHAPRRRADARPAAHARAPRSTEGAMLFVAEYEFGWDALSAAVAKRLEWDAAQPDGFRFVGEYIWQEREPPFRGIAVIEAADVEVLNAFALHYGPTLRIAIHAATDVQSGIAMLHETPETKPRARQARGCDHEGAHGTATLPAWMGDVDPSQIGFPLPVDRNAYRKQTGIEYKRHADRSAAARRLPAGERRRATRWW